MISASTFWGYIPKIVLRIASSVLDRVVGHLRVGSIAGLVLLCGSLSGWIGPASANAEETLPDKRVYEMVTPPNNQQADVYVPLAKEGSFSQGIRTLFPYQVSPNGNTIAYVADATTGGQGSNGNGIGDEYLARRSAEGGWSTSMLQPAGHRSATTFFQGFSSDLSIGVLNSTELPPLSADAPGGEYTVLYSRDDFGGEPPREEDLYQPLFANPPVFNRTAEEFGINNRVNTQGKNESRPVFAGGSTGFGDLFFEANDDVLPAGSPLKAGLDAKVKAEITNHENNSYLYESVGGQSSLVGVLPNGEVAPNATFGAPALAEPKRNPPDFAGVVSPDGRWVYWTDESTGVIYIRVNGEATVPVSEGAAQYWTSADNGRYAFYVAGGQLFRYDAESEAREALTATNAGVLGVIGASEGGENVYAVASTVLMGAGASSEGALPVAGQPNLYLLAQGKEPVFIATLSREDGDEARPMASLSGRRFTAGYYYGDWQAGLGHRTAGVTGGGVVFMSNQSLPVVGFPHGYPNGGADEVYSFQADVNRLFCVSCSASGEPVTTGSEGAAAFLPISWSDVHLPEWTADGGDRVFFDSEVPLVAQDTNGRQDVYEWEREGTGGCSIGSGVNGGCIYLLSGGTSESDSWFIGASESGDDVFIASRAHLTAEDQNDAFNLFDARVGGVRPVTEPLCTGTGCQGVPEPAPTFATPASVTFDGVGNFPAPVETTPVAKPKAKAKPKPNKRCKAAFAKRNGRCVRKHAAGAVRR